MREQAKQIRNEEGFVLVTALLIMLVLTIIGVATTTNTSIELQIAGNDKVHKKTFYEAEAGAMLGSELLEQSFACSVGFSKDSVDVFDLPGTDVRVFDRGQTLALQQYSYDNETEDISITLGTSLFNGNAVYPYSRIDAGETEEIGTLFFRGETQMQPGGALQMAAGYEGKGKAAAQGGVAKIVDIYSQFQGLANSESIILFGWRHLVGQEGDCIY